jgi:hypothetical protein
MLKTALRISLILCVTLSAQAQRRKTYDLADLLVNGKITILNRAVTLLENTDHRGVKLDYNLDEGIVWLNGVTFSEGTIELDMRGKDILQRSFVGVAFHGVNDSTYDAVYFRPFNFKATDTERKIHAVQYISHPTFTWKKLRAERNGVFEKALVNPPNATDWFHARIVVKGNTVNVFVNDDQTPSLTVNKLNDRTKGNIGIWVGDGSDGEFANFSITN